MYQSGCDDLTLSLCTFIYHALIMFTPLGITIESTFITCTPLDNQLDPHMMSWTNGSTCKSK